MTDAQVFTLLDELKSAPSLTFRRCRYYAVPGRVVTMERVGQGERWSFAPSRDVRPLARFLAGYHPREVRTWVERAQGFNVAAHARAMTARVL